MRVFGLLVLFLVAAGVSAGIAYRALAQPAGGSSVTTTARTTPDAPVYSKAGYDVTPLTPQRVEELAAPLSPEEREVILSKGTERAFCGNLLDNKKEGVYVCRLCGLPLFSSDAKFNSGTGWPSFFQPFDRAHVREIVDRSHGMVRTEITCARCDAHLGHVFDDGPKPTGLRYCLNSVSLTFHEKGTELPAASRPIATQTAYFAGGCFWGVEDRFQQTPGVIDAVSGYMGGKTPKPTYKAVCYEDTGHAEAVRVTFDPARITYRQLLEKFFRYHDPTQLNRQGPDVGDQYRSAIFAADQAQLDEARAFVKEQNANPRFKGRQVVTQVVLASSTNGFHDAEEYHQDYHLKNGGHCALPPE
jgi:peptide methionine sulfoxide reductase msrA/msrB